MSNINGYKKALLGISGSGVLAAGFFVANPTPAQPRDRTIVSLVSGIVTTYLIWKV